MWTARSFELTTLQQNSSWEANSSSASQEIPLCCEPKGSWPYLQQPATCRCYQPDQSNPRSPILFYEDLIFILPSTSMYSKLSLYFTSPQQNTVRTSPFSMLHALPISFFLISSPEQYLVWSTYRKAPRYVIFSTPLLLLPS